MPFTPTPSLYTPAGQRKYLNPEEGDRFLEASRKAAPEVRTLCLTLAYTGCRISEALSLTVDQVALDAGHIAVRSLKKRGQVVIREIPIPPALLDELAAVHRVRLRPHDEGAAPL